MKRCRVVHHERQGHRWELVTRDVIAPLRGAVRRISGYRERAPGPLTRREPPGASVVLIVDLGRTLQAVAGGFVAGLSEQAAPIHHPGEQEGLQLDLTPIGARRLLGLPLSELTGREIGLADVLPLDVDELAALPSWDQRFDRVEVALLAALGGRPLDLRLMSWAVDRIDGAGGRLDVARLARELGYSHRHVVTLFRDAVGLPPKRYANLVRFDRLIDQLRAGSAAPWSALAFGGGYYDQAHLAREVRRYTDLTPTELRAQLSIWSG